MANTQIQKKEHPMLKDFRKNAITELEKMGYAPDIALREWVNFNTLLSQKITENPKLGKMHPRDLFFVFLKGISLGLSFHPAAQHLAIIPRGDKPYLDPMYQGLIYLAMKADPEIINIEAQVIYDCDEYIVQKGLEEKLFHRPHFPRPKEAKPVLAYAIVTWKFGFKKWDYIPYEEIEKIRQMAPSDYTWKRHWEEMAKKVIIRRILKTIPKVSTVIADALQADNENYDLKPGKDDNISNLEDIIEFEVVEKPQEEKTQKSTQKTEKLFENENQARQDK